MRGLKVALIDRGDFAGATSSRSSKLIHGGFRYLPQGQFKLVYEALRERERLRHRTAPHLVHPIQFLFPVYRRRGFNRFTMAMGLTLYDLFARMPFKEWHSSLNACRGARDRARAQPRRIDRRRDVLRRVGRRCARHLRERARRRLARRGGRELYGGREFQRDRRQDRVGERARSDRRQPSAKFVRRNFSTRPARGWTTSGGWTIPRRSRACD